MAENVMDQIVAELRRSGQEHYPQRGELRNVRIVGHTPKNDHYIYDIVLDFIDGSERLASKVYRPSKCGAQGVRERARTEAANLDRIYRISQKRKLEGVPRPLGDFTEQGAVVAERLSGLPLQSLIMKAALLPGYADGGTLALAAEKSGEWLRGFHRATADMPSPFDSAELLSELERLCEKCRAQGLDEAAIRTVLSGARASLAHTRKTLPCSAVLNDFTPLNVIVGEQSVGICDYGRMVPHGRSFHDVALFLAAVEALEKYPFCNRNITTQVQEQFLGAYGLEPEEEGVLRVMKMKALLGMFAQGRGVPESAMRKKVMWATVMKRFIQQAAQRALAPAA
jgi:phosphotransferase family enzyme